MEDLLKTVAGSVLCGVAGSINKGDKGELTGAEEEESLLENEGGDTVLEMFKCSVFLGIFIGAEVGKIWDSRSDELMEESIGKGELGAA